jgi:hypothetical protein
MADGILDRPRQRLGGGYVVSGAARAVARPRSYEDAEIEPVSTASGGGVTVPEFDRLSNILAAFNDQFGNIAWTDADRVRQLITTEIPARVAADGAYQNAMANSDRQNARIEHDKALGRVMTAILAATGLDIAEPPAVPQRTDFIAPRPPQAPQEPPNLPERSTEPAEDATKDYVRKERSWRERNNLPRVKRHLSPADTTKGRRERYARVRAAKLGISYDDALAGMSPPSGKDSVFGRPTSVNLGRGSQRRTGVTSRRPGRAMIERSSCARRTTSRWSFLTSSEAASPRAAPALGYRHDHPASCSRPSCQSCFDCYRRRCALGRALAHRYRASTRGVRQSTRRPGRHPRPPRSLDDKQGQAGMAYLAERLPWYEPPARPSGQG